MNWCEKGNFQSKVSEKLRTKKKCLEIPVIRLRRF